MGHDLHITRKETQADVDGPVITFEEWLKYADTDKDLVKDLLDDSSSGPQDFVFLIHSGEPVPLCWFEGEIYAKDPNKQVVKKLIKIAKNLDAHVVDDDDEPYTDWTKYPLPTPKSKVVGLLEKVFG